MSTKSYYEMLGVETSATAEEIKLAFRKLAQQYHPDVSDAPNAKEFFAELVKAYDILSDPSQKSNYDAINGFENATDIRKKKLDLNERRDRSAELVKKMREQVNEENLTEYASTGLKGTTNYQQAVVEPEKKSFWNKVFKKDSAGAGSVIAQTLEISFLEAMIGVKKYLDFRLGNETKRLNVPVYPGISDGSIIRLTTTSSDLNLIAVDVTVRIQPNKFLSRVGNDLIVNVPISLGEAITGVEVMLPTADGDVLKIKFPPFSVNAKKLRVRGRGFKSPNGTTIGDVYVMPEIIVLPEITTNLQNAATIINQEYRSNPREEYSLILRK
ncbi:MAG: DnaJ domain-containing protein [Deltaproteobacteria bacterium]|nr:DnaJ domain-containing protein [Deltaproteobacteria bacterium]